MDDLQKIVDDTRTTIINTCDLYKKGVIDEKTAAKAITLLLKAYTDRTLKINDIIAELKKEEEG